MFCVLSMGGTSRIGSRNPQTRRRRRTYPFEAASCPYTAPAFPAELNTVARGLQSFSHFVVLFFFCADRRAQKSEPRRVVVVFFVFSPCSDLCMFSRGSGVRKGRWIWCGRTRRPEGILARACVLESAPVVARPFFPARSRPGACWSIELLSVTRIGSLVSLAAVDLVSPWCR